jgi:threonyl-tRNA synthetase
MAAQSTDPHYALRHSCSHVLAQALRRMHPETKLAIGPPIDHGFYYDVECPVQLTDADLPQIEAEMRKIVAENYAFKQTQMPRDTARAFFLERHERFKVELIDNLAGDEVGIVTDGEFVDLCRGHHVESTGQLGAFRLLSVAGAYWRGDEQRDQLQRIYGAAFPTEKALRVYLKQRTEAKKRDHRKLGTELELYSIEDTAGPGLVFYHPRGAMVRALMAAYIQREHTRADYQLVNTPHILKSKVWETSGHLEHYKEHMFTFEHDGQGYGVKPMNCPGHVLIYKSRLRSYRDLPVRFFELGNVYRAEKSGVLHGLLRARGFTQDDAHIFCRADQLIDEIRAVIQFTQRITQTFGFTGLEVELSTRPNDFIGSPALWEQAEAALTSALEAEGVSFEVQAGEGAFYGPKIDMKITDAIGRKWQCSTIQCDFALPERFVLKYVAADGQPQRPIMIHRAILGSLERFFGILIEHYAGAFPVWLAPTQAVIVPIAEHHNAFGYEVLAQLKAQDIRAEIDVRHERMQAKIRDAQHLKIPYMLVIGDREQEARAVAVRHRTAGDIGMQSIDTLLAQLLKEQQPGGA